MKNSLSEKECAEVETEVRDDDSQVKLKFEFECPEGLARDLISGIVYLLKGENSRKQLRDQSEALHYLSESFEDAEPDEESPIEKHSPESSSAMEQESASVCPARTRKLSSRLLIILLAVATVLGGFQYSAYKKRKARELAEARQVQKNQQLYEQYLASTLDVLLTKLDQLTATPKMCRVFPDITSMPAIARFKRGPDPADKARAAREFIYEVKKIFDNWVERANDFFPEQRPGREEITYFLSVWADTEKVLKRLEDAKNNPSQAAKTIVP
jgi:hypothetical protein